MKLCRCLTYEHLVASSSPVVVVGRFGLNLLQLSRAEVEDLENLVRRKECGPIMHGPLHPGRETRRKISEVAVDKIRK